MTSSIPSRIDLWADTTPNQFNCPCGRTRSQFRNSSAGIRPDWEIVNLFGTVEDTLYPQNDPIHRGIHLTMNVGTEVYLILLPCCLNSRYTHCIPWVKDDRSGIQTGAITSLREPQRRRNARIRVLASYQLTYDSSKILWCPHYVLMPT